MEDIQFVIAEAFDVHHLIAGGADGVNKFIELEIDRLRVAILGVLNEKHHEKSDDGGPSVDDELPGVGILKDRTSRGPNQHNKHCARECPLGANPSRRTSGKSCE